jgi:hypothetical protein
VWYTEQNTGVIMYNGKRVDKSTRLSDLIDIARATIVAIDE